MKIQNENYVDYIWLNLDQIENQNENSMNYIWLNLNQIENSKYKNRNLKNSQHYKPRNRLGS